MAYDTTMLDLAIFHDLVFTIIPNPAIDIPAITDELVSHGGKVLPFNSNDGRLKNLSEITHIISTTSDFPDYHAALDLFIHVVKPTWVQASIQRDKAANPRSYSPDPALFMSEVTICCGDLPEGDKEAIMGGVIALGGQSTNALSKMVTHLVALDFSDPRCELATQKRLKCHIVLPHWFDDCLKLGRRISERPYTLPDPPILDPEAGPAPPSKTNPHIRHATTPNPLDDPAPADVAEQRAIQAFKGKSLMLGEDLKLNDRLKGVIEGLVKAGGGQVVDNVDDADIYVCHYREGSDYVKASQSNKDVGNLSWLYYLIAHNTWTDPMRRLMHYPRPKNGIPGFDKFKISISSYSGEARVYLENLVKATGAEFTKTFKQDNTHLIAAHTHSEKCEAAKEWGVDLVNHLWIEESYARCQKQTITDPRYTFFPYGTNLGEVLGQTEIDRAAVGKFFFSSQPLVKGRKSKQVAEVAKSTEVSASSAPLSRAVSETVARSPPLVQKSKRAKTGPEVATPSAIRYTDGKENATPGTTGSRGAKDRALSKIHDAAPDMALFEKEMKRKGGVIHGGRRDKDPELSDKTKKVGRESTGSKRSFSEVEEDEESNADGAEEETAPKGRKGKKAKLTPIKYRMLVSKDERWINNPQKEAQERNKLREMGLFISDEHKKVDLLCAPKFVRTKKFVCALAQAPTIVKNSFIDDALKNNKLPSPEKYLLHDPTFEKAQGFRMAEALERARINKGRLLKNWAVFCTDAVVGGYETYRAIVTANGGSCHLWKGSKNAVSVSKRAIGAASPATGDESQNQKEDEGDVLYLISEGKKSELPLWKKFRELATKHDMVPRIVKTEWLLFVAMAQYVHWNAEWELKEDAVK
ncbi:BRCT domain-containing protein [Delitschia confertaspora ATCC 74209]|uniref:BRCT domain-containing protein n=1 Tax=Delitschia confertaspora ATCC 74209 TaxID=1513339 RepID=A0A9P4JLN2_9PLEO|nr:BRCT domain-containing protein [Delitschia confertaspora ATCC 74209]